MRKQTITTAVITGILALVIGVAIGSAGEGEAAAAQPAPAVTKTATKTETKTVEKTPQVCLDALNLADRGFDLSTQSMQAASDGFTAISEMDFDTLEEVNGRLTSLADEIGATADPYNAAKDACRASS